ncbi:MAG: hypothetical protein NDI73_12315 [Desulfuromonadales bacterium]|nr:hypothetical protein [Desulfuromonadales bacterium]
MISYYVRLEILLRLYASLKSFISPRGEFISISGPDGCGKTTILDGATDHFRLLSVFHSLNLGHFRPKSLPRIAEIAKRTGVVASVDENYSEPHRGKSSGFIVSLGRLLYYSIDYLWGYFRIIRPALVRHELVIYDRYFFDMVADPGRSRISLPLWIRKLGLKFLPLPHSAFFIHVDPKTVWQRKQELPLETIIKLNRAYQDLVNAGYMIVLENNDSPEPVIYSLVDIAMARRCKRLKHDDRATINK